MSMNDENLLNALNSVVFYNGYDAIVKGLIRYLENYEQDSPIVLFPDDLGCFKSTQMKEEDTMQTVFWMLCVELFGECGVSLRSGWVEDRNGAIQFLNRLIQ